MTAPTLTCPAFCTRDHATDDPDNGRVHGDTPTSFPGPHRAVDVDMEWRDGEPEPFIYINNVALPVEAAEAFLEDVAGRTFRAREAMKAAIR